MLTNVVGICEAKSYLICCFCFFTISIILDSNANVVYGWEWTSEGKNERNMRKKRKTNEYENVYKKRENIDRGRKINEWINKIM